LAAPGIGDHAAPTTVPDSSRRGRTGVAEHTLHRDVGRLNHAVQILGQDGVVGGLNDGGEVAVDSEADQTVPVTLSSAVSSHGLEDLLMAAKTVRTTRSAAMPAGWREETLARMRGLILEADPEMVEERKWKKPSNGMVGVPVWSHDGIVCTGETYTQVVKLTFAYGASLPDPSRLFNASLDGATRRAIDIREGETVDARAFKALVKAAVARNAAQPDKTRR
jgi:hypothetical protein